MSFGRALIINPTLLLLDEPFGNLDPETRENMPTLFKRVARHHRMTTLFVTFWRELAARLEPSSNT